MERLHSSHFMMQHLLHEHQHRYALLARIAYGDVVDCACGVGYAATILNHRAVRSYRGFDIDAEAIASAQTHYQREGCRFEQGSITDLPLPDHSVDTFAALETLEHLHDPATAITEVARVLKPDGFFFGTVPTRFYDERCEHVYGVNPYHVTRFDAEDINAALKAHFSYVWLGRISFDLVSITRAIGSAAAAETVAELWVDQAAQDEQYGSFLFVAAHRPVDALVAAMLPAGPTVQYAMPKVEVDAEQVMPLYATIHQQIAHIEAHVVAQQKMNHMIGDRDVAIASNEVMIHERDETIKRLEQMCADRDAAIKSNETMIQERDALIARQK